MQLLHNIEKIIQLAQEQKFDQISKISDKKIDNILKNEYQDKSFHYIPYDFKQSGFEKEILEKIFSLSVFQDKNLEVYYNGERGLTEFVNILTGI